MRNRIRISEHKLNGIVRNTINEVVSEINRTVDNVNYDGRNKYDHLDMARDLRSYIKEYLLDAQEALDRSDYDGAMRIFKKAVYKKKHIDQHMQSAKELGWNGEDSRYDEVERLMDAGAPEEEIDFIRGDEEGRRSRW